MAKGIEPTPVLSGKDAERFINIISSPKTKKLSRKEKEVQRMVKNLPKHLKL